VLGSIGSAIRRASAARRSEDLGDLWPAAVFLVARPEFNSIKDLKGKPWGSWTWHSQHTTAKRMLALGVPNADKEMTASRSGKSHLLQALTTNAIQVAHIRLRRSAARISR
jgi:hypothetical protein